MDTIEFITTSIQTGVAHITPELASIWSEECSPDPQSPSYVLYRWICEKEHIFRPAKMMVLAALTIKAFNAHIKNEQVKKLFWKPSDGFLLVEA